MDQPMMLGFAVLLMWGVWAFFTKLTAVHLSARSGLVFSSIGGIIVLVGVLISIGFRPDAESHGVIFALIAGLIASLASIMFLLALRSGKASIIVTMTALYPIITIILSYVFLQERITLVQGAGIMLSLVALVLFSI